MPRLELLITEDELQRQEVGLSWLAWLLVFVSGFLFGAIADLLALWLFAHWMHH